MTPLKRENTIKDIKSLLNEWGYREDRYGNFQKTKGGQDYRYKFTKNGLRREIKCKYFDGTSSWVRLTSGYIKDITITEDRKIRGMKVK